MRLPSALERYRGEIEAELRASLAQRPSPMYDLMRYHLGWIDEKGHPLPAMAGKALRPTLCLLACEAAGGDFRKALPAAAAVELVHNFSLIHDDIQDKDRERRHRPTVWSLWGKPQALKAGTAMQVVANLALGRLQGTPIQKQLRAQHLLNQSCLRMIEGQSLDIAYEGRLDVGVGDYLEMIDKKTAALMACSLEIGALLSSDDEALIGGFRNFGRNLGLAFQIRDDVLGIWGEAEKTGKPQASDLRRRKKSLPVVYALEKTQGKEKRELTRIYQGKALDDEEIATVLRVLEAVQAAQVQRTAEEYRDRALEEIEKMTLSSWARSSLEEMAHFLVEREF